MRLSQPEPPASPPTVVRNPGLADELWLEVRPFLAEEGVHEGDTVPMEQLQQAMDRAVQRRNMALHTPEGKAREAALTVLARTVTDLHDGNDERARASLDAVEPKPADPEAASVAGCIGVAVALLDQWLGGRDSPVPPQLAARARLPRGHWTGEQAGQDLLGLATKARAHSALMKVIARQGGQHVLYGSALALAGTLTAWADLAGEDFADVLDAALR
ncbi:hypothetical protein OIU91_41085 (plasmid) [Streptomyces sp. NBC_01456]|uniref:hypothetical protein n=1 Tax=unclassified Streptomyces TaxID=2593676 RepID=UPI002E3777AD|nr:MULTISPECIES: hypothetical protein [unclassified Streptomyces]